MTENKKYDFMVDRITEDIGEEFAPSRYCLKSHNDAIINPYRTYDLFFEITFHVLQKLGAYEDIGTVEECRIAREKQTAKMPDIEGDGCADGLLAYDTWICPCCGKGYEIGTDDYSYCPNCGQKIVELPK